jgi:beta-exotoxin I transport system permease protein
VPIELLRRGIADHRRALVGWSIGAAAYAAMLASIFPSIRGAADLNKLIANYPEALKELLGVSAGITTGPGYLDVEFFNLILPLLLLVLAIGSGARQVAGEEDAGRLELLLAYPLRRRDTVLVKGAVVAAETAIVAAAVFVALLILDPIANLGLSTGKLAVAVLGVALIALLHGWLALTVGAAGGSRGLAIGIPAALAAAGYLVNGLHGLAGWLDPFRFLSSFWLVGTSPLENGLTWWGVLVVGLAGLVVLGVGTKLFERRDLRVP